MMELLPLQPLSKPLLHSVQNSLDMSQQRIKKVLTCREPTKSRGSSLKNFLAWSVRYGRITFVALSETCKYVVKCDK